MNDAWDEAWIAELVKFDEALRLGHRPIAEALDDPDLEATEQFLLRLQSVWPRKPKHIGPYTLVRSLGQGTIGPAYLVEDPNDLTCHVLKILWPDLSANDPLRRQLKRLAQSAPGSQRKDVSFVREVRETGALCLVILDFFPGPSLGQWRRAHPHPLPWEGVAILIANLADRLGELHRLDLIHGNLKPSNLFLSQAGEVPPDALGQAPLQMGDFGIATAIQDARLPSRTAIPWPAPHYLAPEQLQHRSRRADSASDIYSLGVILYELLTSRSPVAGASREELLSHVNDSPPVAPRQRRADLPGSLDDIVLRCLRRDPAERPASAKLLADLLRSTLTSTKQEPHLWWKQWLTWK